MHIAGHWFQRRRIDPRITLLWEPHVSPLMRCNIWHLRGRDADLIIDTGMGIGGLKQALVDLLDKPVIAVATHTHMDHAGGLHEFEQRLVHPAEAHALTHPDPFPVLCPAHWPEGWRRGVDGYDVPDRLIDAYPHDGFRADTFTTPATDATRLIGEGDVIDLGDSVFQVLHLPGHSPGSIGLWEAASGTLFSGDAIYDGPLLDALPGSDIATYRATMERLRRLPVNVVHAGHDPSFDRPRLHTLIEHYLAQRPA